MSLDIIGKIYDIDNTNPENPIVTELEGWHVNSTELIPEWETFRRTPSHKRRVFAGTQTHCYKFASKTEFEQLYPLTE